MKHLSSRVLPFVTVLALVSCKGEKGSGSEKSDVRQVAEFDEIAATTGIEVTVETGAPASVEVKGDDNLLPHLKTEVSGKRLKVGFDTNVQPTAPLRVKIVMPSVKAIDVSSGAVLKASGLKAEGLEIDAASGANVELKGTAKKLDIEAGAGAHVNAEGLASESVEAKCTAGAEVTVTAAVSASGSTSSGARVHVKGHPQKKEISESSGGKVDYE